MEEALEATKILAEDCRRRGTAFRLGVCWISGQAFPCHDVFLGIGSNFSDIDGRFLLTLEFVDRL